MINNKTLDENTIQQIKTLASSMAKRLVGDAPPDPFRPREALEKQIQITIEQQLKTFFERFVSGVQELMATIINLHKTQPDIDLADVFSEFDKLDRGFHLLGQNPDEVKTLKELSEINDSSIELFNSAAAGVYEAKEYPRAAKIYNFLNILDPNQPAFWLGSGNCEFFEKHYNQALPAYEMAVRLDGSDPLQHFYLAHCYHELNQNDEAVNEVDKAIAVIQANPEMKDQLEQAEQLKQHFSSVAAKR